MASYLVTWKPATENPDRGWPVESLVALSEKLAKTGAASEPWRFRRRSGVMVGERVFVARQGKAGHAIIGYGNVAKLPTKDDGYTRISFEKLLNPRSGTVLATADELRAITNKKGVCDTMASGILLDPDVASKLEQLIAGRVPVPDPGAASDPGEKWSREELGASVEAYLAMQKALHSSQDVNKKAVYRALSARFGRSEKAYEYRMQNISYVFAILGRSWIPGLVPARNVGANVAAQIESALAEIEGRHVNETVATEVQVQRNVEKGSMPKPEGAQVPQAVTVETTQYKRDPDVKAWVLIEAKGKCECCGLKAPFVTAAGMPYLEVHHVRKLSDGGSDKITNAVALCPNCHRQLHHGHDQHKLVAQLYSRVRRLVEE